MKQVAGRRRFIKGLAALGTGIYVLPTMGSCHSKPPLSLLLSSGVCDTRFATGAAQKASLQVRQVCALQPELWLQSIQQLPTQRLIGLMDNASFVVFEALLVDLGARFLVTGHHAQGHRFVTVPETAGVAAAIDNQLAQTRQGYQLRESCRGLPRTSSALAPINPVPQFSDWSALTGACYARIARGEWHGGLPGSYSGSGYSNPAEQDALVSFVVAI